MDQEGWGEERKGEDNGENKLVRKVNQVSKAWSPVLWLQERQEWQEWRNDQMFSKFQSIESGLDLQLIGTN